MVNVQLGYILFSAHELCWIEHVLQQCITTLLMYFVAFSYSIPGNSEDFGEDEDDLTFEA